VKYAIQTIEMRNLEKWKVFAPQAAKDLYPTETPAYGSK